MLIRAGYDIAFTTTQPVPLLANLSIHPSRNRDLRTAQRIMTTPDVPIYDYVDAFGNICTRLTIPTGGITISTGFVIEDSFEADPVVPGARQIPIEKLPDDILVYLLGSRYCETDRLSGIAWSLFGGSEPGWARVQGIVDYVHERIRFDYQTARPTKTAWDAHEEREGVCRDFAHLAIALCRCMNIPARYCTGYIGRHGSARDRRRHGLFSLVRRLSRRSMVYVRCPPQPPAPRPHPDGARPRRDRRGIDQQLRSSDPDTLSGLYRRGPVGFAVGLSCRPGVFLRKQEPGIFSAAAFHLDFCPRRGAS